MTLVKPDGTESYKTDHTTCPSYYKGKCDQYGSWEEGHRCLVERLNKPCPWDRRTPV